MSIKLKKNSKNLLDNEFAHKSHGYDPLEVDTVLDEIIKDYRMIESNVLLEKKEYENMLEEISKLKKEVVNLKIDLEKSQNKWKYLKSDSKDVCTDNLVLLERIGKLEEVIYNRLHISPEDAITFDPDDC